jgi:hypothetical protein
VNLTLSRPLLDACSSYCEGRFPGGIFSRDALTAVNRGFPVFESMALHVSSFKEYLRLISFLYSKDTAPVRAYFNDAELDALQSLVDRCGAEPSKIYALLLCSLFFTSGKFPIAVKDFLSYFESEKLDYGYQIFVTREISDLFRAASSEPGGLPLTVLARAAHFYYEKIAPGDLRITESPAVTVTNFSTGWKKIYVRGSLKFKNYLFGLKSSTGKTINCVASNVMYQFLSAMKEAFNEGDIA